MESAAFRPDDPEVLIAASLGCPCCLSDDVARRLGPTPHDPTVACACRACGHARTVSLEPWQYLRLALIGERALDHAWEPDALALHLVW